MNITMVKKVLLNGKPCAKSARVLNELEEKGLLPQIDQIISADERQPSSEGFALAAKHKVEAAPFFIVNNSGYEQIYETYYRFLSEIFHQNTSQKDEISEIMAQNPDLDFI